MSPAAPKRFYEEAKAATAGSGFGILLDGKTLRSPAQRDLIVPTMPLAAAIADEWSRQGEKIQPHSMPLMQLAATTIDRVAPARAEIAADILGYARTDLVCYRADGPPALVERQSQAWDPLIDWLRRRYDVALRVTAGIVAVAQPAATLEALERAIAGRDDFSLAAFATMTNATGSLVIALALAEGEITPEEASHAAQLDELFQAERWGEDAEAIERRVAQLGDLVAARKFMDLLAAGDASGDPAA